MFLERKEGNTRVIVPKQPSKSIFYNPKMELSRDIDVASVSFFISRSSLHSDSLSYSYADALAGTGVRGVRTAKEVEQCVEINDWSKDAYEVIKRNIELNEVEEKAKVRNENANIMLHRKKYDIVDIDPFGSPVPFLDAACRSVKKLLLVTATDIAPLCGAHPSGMRKYGAVPLNTEYYREMATRVLLGTITRYLAKNDKAAIPLLSYSKEHFIRVIVGVEKGVKKAENSRNRLGFIAHCFSCGNRFALSLVEFLNLEHIEKRCSVCYSKIHIAGPLYIEAIKEKEFCEGVCGELIKRGIGEGKRRKNGSRNALKIVKRCAEELDTPFYYEHHAICKRLKKKPSSISSIIKGLKEKNFSASRTHFSDTAFKTNATIIEIKEILKKL